MNQFGGRLQEWLTLRLLLLAFPFFDSSSSFADANQIEVAGTLQESPATKGGAGFDDCLGSPYFYIRTGPKDEIRKLSFLTEAVASWKQREALIGKQVRIKGNQVDKQVDGDKHWAPKTEEEKMLQRPHYSIDDQPVMINCKYIEVVEISEIK